MYREFFSAAGLALTFIIFIPYIRSIRAGETKPHVFSWVIWGLGTFVVFLAQLSDGGGVGAWPIGLSGLITGYIAILAYRTSCDLAVTRSDWGFLISALLALPCWFLTSDPLWAVIILTAVDLAGFGPTFRRAYQKPHDERMGFFALASVRNLLVILALEHHSLTTVLFPAAVGLGCLVLVVLLASRRRASAARFHRR